MIWQKEEWPDEWTKSVLITITKEGRLPNRLCKLQNNCTDCTSQQDSSAGNTSNTDNTGDTKRVSQRRASWIQKRQKYCATDPHSPTAAAAVF